MPQAYKDPVGIWTRCFGDIRNVTPGTSYTFEECLHSLNTQIEAHAGPVLKCVPSLSTQPDKVKAAMISMAYNIGVSGFCSTSVARYANAVQWERACRRMAEIYRTARGRQLPGLVNRRNAESELCLEGLRVGIKEGCRW